MQVQIVCNDQDMELVRATQLVRSMRVNGHLSVELSWLNDDGEDVTIGLDLDSSVVTLERVNDSLIHYRKPHMPKGEFTSSHALAYAEINPDHHQDY